MRKKETYFDVDTLQAQSQRLLGEVESKVGIHRLEFNPDKAALLVLDMQKYFLNFDSHAFIPSMPAMLPNIIELQKVFLGNNRPVIQTRHLNTDDNAGMMKKWWKDLINPGNSLSELSEEIRDPRARLFEKTRYDAFHGTDLETYLRNLDVTQLVIAGVMTHLCCETTARAAFVRDFEIFFTVDATATYSLDLHRASLLNLGHGFSDLRMSCDIMDAFKNHENQR